MFDGAAVLLANGQASLVGGFTRGGTSVPLDPVRESVVFRLGASNAVGAQDVPDRRGALRAAAIPSSGPAGSSLVVTGGFDENGVAQDEVYVLEIDDELTALADTLTDEEALALGVFATALHLFQDGLVGYGDVDLVIVEDPVRGRRVRGWVGSFEVTLELDAGTVVGDVEGKPYALVVTGGFVSAPDFQVDFRPATYVDGDMDVDNTDYDFDVDRLPRAVPRLDRRLRGRGRAARRGRRTRHRPLPVLSRRLLLVLRGTEGYGAAPPATGCGPVPGREARRRFAGPPAGPPRRAVPSAGR